MKPALFVMMLLWAQAVWGDDASRNYSARAPSCGIVVEDYEDSSKRNSDPYFSVWLGGYITAYNRLTPDTYNILGDSDWKSAILRVYGWCKANPLENLSGAAEALTAELFPNRHRTSLEAGR